MSASDPGSPDRFRFLASFVAGRPVGLAEATAGKAAHTDGQFVFVSAGRSPEEQRREVLVQCALLGAGSFEPGMIRTLRGRPMLARRYLALEGRRVLAGLSARLPLAATLCPAGEPATASAAESLDVARSRRAVTDAPEWFGEIFPSLLRGATAGKGVRPKDHDLHLDPGEIEDSDDDEKGEQQQESTFLRLFDNPLFNSDTLANLFSKLLGGSRSPAEEGGGGDMPMRIRSIRQVDKVGPNARPVPVPLQFTGDDTPGATAGFGGALYPEWDVHNNCYRPQWCRVIDIPLGPSHDTAAAGVERDDMLRRRLARLGLGPKAVRRQPDGDDLDVDALIDFAVDLHSGYSPPDHIYRDRRKLARNLGVLILLDASGSANETDSEGMSVHEHQRRAAATLAVTLESLGDRLAVYGFRSHGRAAVHLLTLKPFGQRFGAGGRAQLNQLQPAGHTRLGAAIRHAGEILKTEAGTPNRLLLVLSDGFPYDDGYESQYAEADTSQALAELRSDGIACLCLSIGSSTATDALQRVFGSASHASAALLGELSPCMDKLFLGALKELAVPRSTEAHAVAGSAARKG